MSNTHTLTVVNKCTNKQSYKHYCSALHTSSVVKKGKADHAPQDAGAHLPLPGLEPVGGEPLTSVMNGQCDARPTVTFPATRHHRPLAATKLYCLVTEAHVC